MSYKSPIEMFYDDTIQNLANQIRQETDDRIVCEVNRQCGVNIDRYELAKALKYDRDQYNKGYQDAMTDARQIGEWVRDDDDFLCSRCGSGTHQPTLMGTPMFAFCPICGAYMKGEEE